MTTKILVWDFFGTLFSFSELREAVNSACNFKNPENPTTVGVHESQFSPFSFIFGTAIRDFMACSTTNNYKPLIFVMETALQRLGLSQGECKVMVKKLTQLPPSDGAEECLAALQKKGIKQAIVTHSGFDATTAMVKKYNLEEYFQFIMSVDEVQAAKPSPKVYSAAIEHIKHKVGECELYYIASHPFDVIGATTAGFKTILVDASKNGSEKSMVRMALGNDSAFTVSSLLEVADLFKQDN